MLIFGERRGATGGNVAGSVPDGIIGIFHWYKISLNL